MGICPDIYVVLWFENHFIEKNHTHITIKLNILGLNSWPHYIETTLFESTLFKDPLYCAHSTYNMYINVMILLYSARRVFQITYLNYTHDTLENKVIFYMLHMAFKSLERKLAILLLIKVISWINTSCWKQIFPDFISLVILLPTI